MAAEIEKGMRSVEPADVTHMADQNVIVPHEDSAGGRFHGKGGGQCRCEVKTYGVGGAGTYARSDPMPADIDRPVDMAADHRADLPVGCKNPGQSVSIAAILGVHVRDIQCVKHGAMLQGLRPGVTRLPMQPMTKELASEMDEIVRTARSAVNAIIDEQAKRQVDDIVPTSSSAALVAQG